ncbi:MAG TPA: AAA family ATPase, partial [Acidobacteriota bacterium]|nr:AAA family ATPase [Acidobacteriota bacterium]
MQRVTMLRLDKLEIRGFKSFCDFTEVVFHEGITAIVGPNGCGKSNVMDAVIWVLGEQSAKNLRGGKMEDIIFNGTRDRKPLGMAEVLLTFTAVADIEPDKNLEDDLSTEDLLIPEIPIEEIEESLQQQFTGEPDQPASEVSSEETSPAKTQRRGPRKFRIPTLVQGEKITIGRRLYRSGESDYLINGRTCRLRDILDFFSGTGLSRARYAIIEQGRIGQVLSSKPHDRRALIEEAAGVAKFKAKRHAAEVKLESTRQNLSRLND